MKPLFFDGVQKPNKAALNAFLSFSDAHPMMEREVRLLAEACDEIARFVCASKKDQLFFFTSQHETLNAIFQALYVDLMAPTGRNHVLTTAEHAKVLEPFTKVGVVAKVVEPNEQGLITAEQIAEMISPRTAMLTLPWADHKTGVIYPIWEIAKVARDQGVYVHVDASAILGKLFFRFEDLPVDFLSFEGSATGAPQGTGALFQKFLTPIELSLPEVAHAGIMALGESIFEMRKRSEFACLEMARLRNLFEEKVNAEVLFFESERLPQVSCMRFPGIHAEYLLYHLVHQKLFAAYVPEKNAISFSLSQETTEEDVEKAVEVINGAAKKLQEMSPC